MSALLEANSIPEESGVVLRLAGVIDEHFDVEQLTTFGGSFLVIDLGGVYRITSFGVREWIFALSKIKADYYCFINCRPAVMAQFNMVSGFAGHGKLLSFYAPYVCPECDHEQERLIDLRGDCPVVTSGDPEEIPCSNCGADSEFDDIPEAYFAYASAQDIGQLPPLVENLIDGEVTEVRGHLRVRKDVQGDVTALHLSGPINDRARLKRILDGVEGHVIILGSEITSVTQEGLEKFHPINHSAESVSLAGLSLPLAAELVRHQAFSKSKLLSVNITLQCHACNNRHGLSLDSRRLEAHAEGGPLLNCLKCQGRPKLDKDAEGQLQQAKELVASSYPEEVSSFFRIINRRKGSGVITLEDGQRQGQGDARTYSLQERIGTGGMAEIFLAKQTGAQGFEKQVVVKRILPNFAANALFIDMFRQEALLAAHITHSNVVQIYDLGRVEEQYCIIMEYVKGQNLRELINSTLRKSMEIPIGVVCRILSDICAGLHAAHTCQDPKGRPLGIVHRDVSPANVLVSDEGISKLTDFGVAKAFESVSLTQPGELKGKLLYLAPEQVVFPDSAASVQSDLFALGLVFYETLTGRHPFRRSTKYASLSAIVAGEYQSALSQRPDLPPELEQILTKALSKAPEDRYQSANELRAALDKAATELKLFSTTGQLADWIESMREVADVQGDSAVDGHGLEESEATSLTALNSAGGSQGRSQ